MAPESALAHLLLGVVQMHTDRASQGVASCERALDLDRNMAVAHAQIGDGKLLLGQPEETEGHIQEALRLSPRDAHVYLWCMFAALAKMSLGQGRGVGRLAAPVDRRQQELSELAFPSGGRSGADRTACPKRGLRLEPASPSTRLSPLPDFAAAYPAMIRLRSPIGSATSTACAKPGCPRSDRCPPAHLPPPNAMTVDVPWASTLPSRSSTLASVEMI